MRDVVDDLSAEAASGLLQVFFDVGDNLLQPEDEQGFSNFPNQWRLQGAVKNLLQRVPKENKIEILRNSVWKGESLSLVVQIIDRIDEALSKQGEQTESPFAEITPSALAEFKQIAVSRLVKLNPTQLLKIADFSYVTLMWSKWAGEEAVREATRPLWDSDEHLPYVLEKYLSFGTSQGFGDRVAKKIPRMNPNLFNKFTDIDALVPRVQLLLESTALANDQRTAAETFIKSKERIANGNDPDGFISDDD